MRNINEQTLQRLVLGLIIVMFAFIFYLIEPRFLSIANITQFSKQLPLLGMLAIGMTFLLVSGNVDLSIGAIAAFAGTLAVYLSVQGLPFFIVLPAAIAVGAGWGFLNGIIVTSFDLQPFILTMGTNFFIRGTLLFVTNGTPIQGTPDWFYALSNTQIIGPIYSNTLAFIVIAVVVGFILNKTTFGRNTYAVGSNKEAARLSGIEANKHVVKVYMIEGVIAAIAGIFLMSQINIGGPAEADGMDLYSLAAAVIGGAQLNGGVGTVIGTIFGIFIIKIIENGLSIIGSNAFLQQAVIGGIIVIAIVIDALRSRYGGLNQIVDDKDDNDDEKSKKQEAYANNEHSGNKKINQEG